MAEPKLPPLDESYEQYIRELPVKRGNVKLSEHHFASILREIDRLRARCAELEASYEQAERDLRMETSNADDWERAARHTERERDAARAEAATLRDALLTERKAHGRTAAALAGIDGAQVYGMPVTLHQSLREILADPLTQQALSDHLADAKEDDRG